MNPSNDDYWVTHLLFTPRNSDVAKFAEQIGAGGFSFDRTTLGGGVACGQQICAVGWAGATSWRNSAANGTARLAALGVLSTIAMTVLSFHL